MFKTSLSKIAVVVTSFAAGVTLTLLSVGYHAPTVAADEAEIAHMEAVKAQVMHTTYQLDSSGLHAIDEGTHAGSIPSGALGNVRRARIMTQSAHWPDALKPMATDLVGTMKSLEDALRTEDPAKAADLAKKVHDDAHDLSAAVYTWLDTGAVPASGGHGH
jgi:hypothetical protein